MNVKTFYFNPIRVCTYLLSADDRSTIVIDCGAYTANEKERLEQYISSNNLHITHHLLTHAHPDHCFGARFIYEQYGILPEFKQEDIKIYKNLELLAEYLGMPLADKPLDDYILLGDSISLGDTTIQVIPTPGHSSGSVCFYLATENLLFSGDTLFQGGIGRTDLPGSDYSQMIQSIATLKTLPEQTAVLPGHGPATSIAQEKAYNPYLNL